MKTARQRINARERRTTGADGYALVALLALMTILMLAVMTAAPDIRRQNQRELEQEAIIRGEEVAEAIRLYTSQTGHLPTSMEQLREGVPRGVKKIQVLRAYAAHDPLSTDGEWRLIKPNDPAFVNFAKAVALYNGGQLPPTRDQRLQNLVPVPVFTSILNTKPDDKKDDSSSRDDESSPMSSEGPFIGVATSTHRDSMLTYYDIEREEKWVFTPLFK